MERTKRVVAFALLALALGCGSDDNGVSGDITSEAALQGAMFAIALDFAQVLADVAPSGNFAVKGAGSTANCPEGGQANYFSSGVGAGGTLTLDQCRMRGVDVSGNLSGFLFADSMSLSADNLVGQVSLNDGSNLNVQRLTVSATLPIEDATTFWQIEVITMDGDFLCAWSGAETGPCPGGF